MKTDKYLPSILQTLERIADALSRRGAADSQPPIDPHHNYTVEEITIILGVSRATAHRLTKNGTIPTHRYGVGRGRKFIKGTDLLRYIDESKVERRRGRLKHLRE
jgi:excisionase family DNA binding protein